MSFFVELALKEGVSFSPQIKDIASTIDVGKSGEEKKTLHAAINFTMGLPSNYQEAFKERYQKFISPLSDKEVAVLIKFLKLMKDEHGHEDVFGNLDRAIQALSESHTQD